MNDRYPNTVTGTCKPFSCSLGDFVGSVKLILPAKIDAKGTAWPERSDKWSCVIERGYGHAITFDYYTGTGLRSYPKGCNLGRPTTFDIKGSRARRPDTADLLECLLSDASCHIAARDYEYPEDYYMEEMGYESVKEARPVMQGCKQSYNQLVALGLTEENMDELQELLDS